MKQEKKIDELILIDYKEGIKDFFDDNLIHVKELGIVSGEDVYVFMTSIKVREEKWSALKETLVLMVDLADNTMHLYNNDKVFHATCTINKSTINDVVEKLI